MPTSVIVVSIGFVFVGAYRIYARRVARSVALEDKRITPAVRLNDGYDFIPTRRGVLLAQHFASISAAGPIVGPIAAALAFGWGPTLAWIVLGSIFIGACHDFSSLVASVRHDARSIPELAKSYLGPGGYYLSLGFIWLCLIYVIIAFTDVTAQQFVAVEQWDGTAHAIGGGVATSSFLYLALSIFMGWVMTRWKLPLSLVTALFFPALLAIIWLGQKFPLVIAYAEPVRVWGIFLLAYCAVASVLPLWLLLQPRGYLGGFFLYLIMAIGLIGLSLGGLTVEYPAFKGFYSRTGDAIFPFLFITVACGACSGFHGLVCSGTTSKQLQHETHAPLVGYGGMLLEGVVAVLALSTVMIWPADATILSKSPAEIYATGVARLAHSVFGLDIRWGVTFGMLAFATFVYDTLDVATRLGRYLLEELFQLKSKTGRWMATAVTLLLPLVYVVLTPELVVEGKKVALWASVWPLFGSSNQLLAALTLLLMTVWLRSLKRSFAWLAIPAAFMLCTAFTALVYQWFSAVRSLQLQITAPALINICVSTLLMLVSISFTTVCFKKINVSVPSSTQ